MGYYIDPSDCSKEEFLVRHGERLSDAPCTWDFSSDVLPVCLVDNYEFTAAGIAYSERELEAFVHPDGRSKKWYSVSRESLKPYYRK